MIQELTPCVVLFVLCMAGLWWVNRRAFWRFWAVAGVAAVMLGWLL